MELESLSARDNFGKFIHQFQPEIKTLIRKLKRIIIKSYRQNVSLSFNQTPSRITFTFKVMMSGESIRKIDCPYKIFSCYRWAVKERVNEILLKETACSSVYFLNGCYICWRMHIA